MKKMIMSLCVVLVSATAFTASASAATFDACVCEGVSGYRQSWANLHGMSFVKNEDGIVRLKKSELNRVSIDFEHGNVLTVLRLCEKEKARLIKRNICPAE